MDLTLLPKTVQTDILAFQHILREKATRGDIFSNPYITEINRGCDSLVTLMVELSSFAQRDKAEAPPRQLDPSTSHLCWAIELGLSSLSGVFFVLRAYASVVAGQEQKAKFWTSKVKYKWDEEILEDMHERIREAYNILLILLEAVLYPYEVLP